jgi:hypothetical protein
MMRKILLTLAFLVIIGAAATLFTNRTPPPGFISIREAPAFQNETILTRAWSLPVATQYPRPILSQTNPSACGPTSIANLLRSGGLSSTTADQIADHGTGCFHGICFGGLTLEGLAAATRASTSAWEVTVLHPATVDALRDELRQANEPERRYVMNFSRFPLFGTGGGHHSPIGGYLEAEDLVFVLDVNASYQPWLVSTARLFEAMDTLDSASGEKRGLIRLERALR